MILQAINTLLLDYNYCYGNYEADLAYPYIVGEYSGDFSFENNFSKGTIILTLHHKGLHSELEQLRQEVQDIFQDVRIMGMGESLYMQYERNQFIPSLDLDLVRMEVHIKYTHSRGE